MIAHTCGLLTLTMTTKWWQSSREHCVCTLSLFPAYSFCTALSGGCGRGRKQRVILRTCVKLIHNFFPHWVGKWSHSKTLQLTLISQSQSGETAEQRQSSFWMSEPLRDEGGDPFSLLCRHVWISWRLDAHQEGLKQLLWISSDIVNTFWSHDRSAASTWETCSSVWCDRITRTCRPLCMFQVSDRRPVHNSHVGRGL